MCMQERKELFLLKHTLKANSQKKLVPITYFEGIIHFQYNTSEQLYIILVPHIKMIVSLDFETEQRNFKIQSPGNPNFSKID